MVNAFTLLASFASVSAFSNLRAPARASLKMSFENELGVIKPTGFWDPLNLLSGADKPTFDQRRTAELKHGRIAMLAVVGLVVQEYTRLPGAIDLDGTTFSSIPNGVAALSAVPAFGWFQIAASIGYWEVFGWKQTPGAPIGDFGFFSPGKSTPVTDDLRLKEIQNGRLAMIGIAELLTHDFATDGPLFSLTFK